MLDDEPTWGPTQVEAPHVFDPSETLPGEVSPQRRRRFVALGLAIVLFCSGTLLGLYLAPDTPATAAAELKSLRAELDAARATISQLEGSLLYREVEAPVRGGHLKESDRQRHVLFGRQYAETLRRQGAQSAAELMEWFVGRWNKLLEDPQDDDRVNRRAATLGLLVGGMAEAINPQDYVAWQAEFLNGRWLGELHFDLDGDGLPGKRAMANPKDGFAATSVCQIAMALNLAASDAQILVMPNMRCDRPDTRMSIFLHGSTFNDAITQFVVALKREGYSVVERYERGVRLVLVGDTRGPRRRN